MNSISLQGINTLAASQSVIAPHQGVTPQAKPTESTELPEYNMKFGFRRAVYKGADLPLDVLNELSNLYTRRADLAKSVVVNTVFDMRKSYTDVQIDLANKHPDLLQKDWDVTVDPEGELLIVEGEDRLTEKEMKTIIDIMTEHGLDGYMKNLAENIVERGVGGRGYIEYQGGHDIGQYDVTMENISKILRGRELMGDAKIRPINIGSEKIWRPIEEYNKNKMDPYMAVFKQVVARSERVYHTEDRLYIDVTDDPVKSNMPLDELRKVLNLEK